MVFYTPKSVLSIKNDLIDTPTAFVMLARRF